MLKFKPILLSVVVLVLVTLACSTTGVPTVDPNAISTAVAQTLIAQSSQTLAVIVPITGAGSPIATFTPELPSLTPTSTLSPTPLFTATPTTPQITVSVATNCRVGPGKAYDRVGALLVGEVAEVYGRDLTGNYWYIRNPDLDPGFCWVWGEYASLTGDTLRLPILTPPPTPTPAPAFDASYDNSDACIGWWEDFRLKNIGTIAFHSISITVRDRTDSKVSMTADGFTNNDGCYDSSKRDSLDPGGVRIVSGPSFSYDPNDHDLRATLTLCSDLGQTGTCVTQVIDFTP
jgi:hypothetical protein